MIQQLLLSTTLVCAANCVAQDCELHYEVTAVIQPPVDCPIDDGGTTALAINNRGHVVGSWSCGFGDQSPFYWDGTTTHQLPGALSGRAFDLNDHNVVVGSVDVPDDGLGELGFVFDGAAVHLLSVIENGTYSVATAINNDGLVVGRSGNNVTGPGLVGVSWRDGVLATVPFNRGTTSALVDVNEFGTASGYSGHGHQLELIQTDLVSPPQFLGTVPGSFTLRAFAMNNTLHMVGTVTFEDEGSYSHYGLTWQPGDAVPDALPDSPCGNLTLRGINDLGMAVGIAEECPSGGAILWDGNEILDLNAITAGANTTIAAAHDINNRGQIAATTAVSTQYSVVLSPIVPDGDVNLDCRVDVHDLLDVLSDWGRAFAPADLDQNGTVDSDDLWIVLGGFGS